MEQRFCTKCGNPLREGAMFCNKCGAKVTPMDIEKEGTVLLVNQMAQKEPPVKRGFIILTDAEKSLGANKVVDFGTGKRFSVSIPGGVVSGSRIRVRNTGLIDPDLGVECEIELVVK